MAINELQLLLTEIHWISPRVKHFIGELITDEPFNFIAGQFITILFQHEDKLLRRSYSIANSPKNSLRIEFAAGQVDGGPGTAYLFSRQPGDTLKITGPFGRLILKDDLPFKRLVLVATSTGITPYRSMLPLLEQHPSLQVEIIEGVGHKEDILFEHDFLEAQKQSLHIRFHAALSREKETQAPHHYLGHVQDVLNQLQLNASEDLIYLCGNPSMIDDTTAQLQNQGFNIQQIIREKYLSR
ncbi:MAG: ferredoxin--NADP reductase [Gammaproteobacteria bacterium]|nr:ferredoxin--NADP reductase [Gammaproteobacteria bacterium]